MRADYKLYFIMKKITVGFLLLALMFVAAGQPSAAFARNNNDDNRSEHHDSEDDDDSEDEDNSDNDSDENEDDELEVEADVFTDLTIVKVELSDGTKSTFSTDAQTEEEVAEVVAGKFDLTTEAVLKVLDLEVEDHPSRSGDRMKIKDRDKDHLNVCRVDSSSELEVEADVFSDTTIVKVELASGTKSVFETSATTSEAIAQVVADKYSLTLEVVKSVLEVDIEDRASRPADRVLVSNSSDCDEKSDDKSDREGKKSVGANDAELRSQIAELQRMLATLLALFNARFGTGQ